MHSVDRGTRGWPTSNSAIHTIYCSTQGSRTNGTYKLECERQTSRRLTIADARTVHLSQTII
jgi:hypothetical protein